MADVYTSGSWRVKEGRGDEFVAAWRELLDGFEPLTGEAVADVR